MGLGGLGLEEPRELQPYHLGSISDPSQSDTGNAQLDAGVMYQNYLSKNNTYLPPTGVKPYEPSSQLEQGY
jgi:hypothetical protein